MIGAAKRKTRPEKRIVFVILTAVFTVFACNAWAASGSVTITSPDLDDNPGKIIEFSGNFNVQGTFIMSEDDTPNHQESGGEHCGGGTAALYPTANLGDGAATHGFLYAVIDGGRTIGPLATISSGYWGAKNLGIDVPFSVFVGIGGLEPKKFHTATFELRDLYSVSCKVGSRWQYPPNVYYADPINLATLRFRIPGDPPLISFIYEKNFGESTGFVKDPSQCPVRPVVGNPVNLATGNKYQKEVDLSTGPTPMALAFTRHYNSQSGTSRTLGHGWTHTYDRYLEIKTNNIVAWREDGRAIYFTADTLLPESGAGEQLSFNPDGGYSLTRPDDLKETYDNGGRLMSVTDLNNNIQTLTHDDKSGHLLSVSDPFHRILSFSYDTFGKIESITDPAGNTITYGYDANDNLSKVTYPDGSIRTYHYEDVDIHNLTGITNENGVRFATFAYDAEDRATLSTHVGDTYTAMVSYDDGTTRTVVDGRGNSTIYKVLEKDGVGLIEEVSGSGCSGCGGSISKQFTFDDSLNVLSVTDGNGIATAFTYDSGGNILSRTEAVGMPEVRTTTYTYAQNFHRVESISQASVTHGQNKVTTFNYDVNGNLIERTEVGYTGNTALTYTTTYTYNARGQVILIDGPRAGDVDVTAFAYNDQGNLATLTRGGTLSATFSAHNGYGSPGQITDPNGQVKVLSYEVRNRLQSVTSSAGTTSYTYDLVGNLTSVQFPNGNSLQYTYDEANRVIRVTDGLGNAMSYGYDIAGNRTGEHINDSFGTLTRTLSYEYDSFNRLVKIIYPDATFDEFTYDGNGNRTGSIAVEGRITSFAYDHLNRIKNVIQPGNVVTSYTYNIADNPTSVTDAEGHVTTYTYDDLGRLSQTVSPDTGTTYYTYDEAGNQISKTDASGVTRIYTYDGLNRLTKIDYPSDPDVTYTYDIGSNGKGRLTGMNDVSGSYVYIYDALGNLIQEDKTIEGVTYTTAYGYDAAGLLTGITYPDGRAVTYDLDSAGRVTRVTTAKDGVTRILAKDISYAALGPMKGLTYGNGIMLSQSFDQRYRLTGLHAGGILDFTYTHDGTGNITAVTNNLDDTRSQNFGYDVLNRLTDATGIYGSVGYTYDKVGNRLTRTVNGQAEDYAYEAGTNRLLQVAENDTAVLSYSYDANGAITGVGDKSFVYGQNIRLILATENVMSLGEYTYNGAGQRIIKRASADTTIYHYDKDGNLISESMSDGTIVRSYVYLGATRLARIDTSREQEFTVRVETSKGKTPSGLKVYAFTEGDFYTGKQATTNAAGIARFLPENLTEGTYKFRVDYLGGRFWSEVVAMPGASNVSVLIEEESVKVAVTTALGTSEGTKVYLFSENNAYLGIHGAADEAGTVSFDLPVGMSYKFRADNLRNQYWSEMTSISSGGTVSVAIQTGGGMLQVTVQKDQASPMEGVTVYLFGASESYLGLSLVTDASGTVKFNVSEGTYKVRVDYKGYQFWSVETLVMENTNIDLTVSHEQVELTFEGLFQGTPEPLEGIRVYLFTPTESYLGLHEDTDTSGWVTFDLPQEAYKVRADYLGRQFWSGEFTWEDTTVEVSLADADITVTGNGAPLAGVEVSVFTNSGYYLDLHATTDGNGCVIFRLPTGDYLFRADYQGSQYWSTTQTLEADKVKSVALSTGGGSVTIRVLKDVDESLVGVKCYVFSAGGAYLGISATTNGNGEVSFDLADGSYQFRVDCLGYQFWTEQVEVFQDLAFEFTIAHQVTTITVEGVLAGDVQPRKGIPVYLFSPSGSYLSVNAHTDGNGQVVITLPERAYKVRADYLGQQFWSEEFTWQDTTVTIPEGTAQVKVTMAGQDIEGAKFYVFSSSNRYLGVNGITDEKGIVELRMPAGSYKFRADHQGTQYWASTAILEDTTNYVDLETGGGEFVLTIDTGSGPLANTKVYVFNVGGSYLGISATTDANGQVSFDLSDGSYKFRVDHLGYQFWTGVSGVPQTLSDDFTIQHQQSLITVEGDYLSAEPIVGVKVYLFKLTGSYLGKYQVTDSNGQVSFNLPDREYKVRVDYLGEQFWSNPFESFDTTVAINQGLARVHAHRSGVDVEGAKVYLFSEGGSYLGKNETTDAYGEVEFLLPDRAYKFRVDEGGNQYWSGVIDIIAGEENPVELDHDLLALDLTHDPHPEVFHGMSPAYGKEIRLASLSLIQGLLANVVLADIPQDRIFYYHNDHLGTPQKITDENGQVVWSADFAPFGEANVTTAIMDNNFRFPGQYYDQETGLHYNYFRYYDPTPGKYLTPDPIGLIGGINPFVYADGNPVNAIDPSGLFFQNMPGWLWKASNLPGKPPKAVTEIVETTADICDEIIEAKEWLIPPYEQRCEMIQEVIPSYVGYSGLQNFDDSLVTAYVILGTADAALLGEIVYPIFLNRTLTDPQGSLDFVTSMFPGLTPTMNWEGVYGVTTGTILKTHRW